MLRWQFLCVDHGHAEASRDDKPKPKTPLEIALKAETCSPGTPPKWVSQKTNYWLMPHLCVRRVMSQR